MFSFCIGLHKTGIFLVASFGVYTLQAQEVKLPSFIVKDFSTAAGLCNGNIRFLTKDSNGYLWIGTANGLSRFDGHFFTNFFHTPEDTASLGHNFIQGIICDEKGKLWILHGSGLSLFNTETHTFTNYPIQKYYPHFSSTYHLLAEGTEGVFWIGNQNGLALFDSRQRRFLALKEINKILGRQDYGFAGTGIQGMVKGKNGDIWFNTYSSIYKWEKDKQYTKTIGAPPFRGGTKTLAITDIDTLHDILYAGTYEAGLLSYNYQTNEWRQFRTNDEALSTPTYDPVKLHQKYNNQLYVYISDLGYGFFNPQSGLLMPQKPVPFSKERVMQGLLAENEYLWLGTDNGLLLLTPEKIPMNTLTTSGKSEGAFNTIQLHPYKEVLLSGNYGSQKSFEMPLPGGTKTELKDVKGLIRYYFVSHNRTEWISTENEVIRKRPFAKSREKVPITYAGIDTDNVLPRNMVEDAWGRIWLRVRNAGIFVFDSTLNSFTKVDLPSKAISPVFSGLAYCTKTNTLWVSEENSGLYALTAGKKSWEHHPLLVGNTILTPARILLTQEANIAFPDPFNGIGIYNPFSKKTFLISQKNGMLSNNISSISADDSGNIWTFSSEGLSRIMRGTNAIANFSHPGISKIQEIACGKNGMVFIATANGLFSFEGNQITQKELPRKIELDKIEVMGKAIPLNSKYSFPTSSSDIRITFSYIDLHAEKKPAFEYCFEGENQWKTTGEQNNISFSRLGPGLYKLFIRHREQEDQNSWQQVVWTIEKPVWQRPWFFLPVMCMLAGIGYFILQRRISGIREKSALLHKMAETEMAALQAQMNPHFLFNALNSIDAMVQEGDRFNATTYLNKFARLIRNVLDGSRQKTVSLSQDIESLKLYLELESMRLDNSFDWTISGAEDLMQMDIKIPSLMIQPYVENAILHGVRHLKERRGNINIDYRVAENTLISTITDNGNGRAFTQNLEKTKTHSHGMAISKSRIENFNYLSKGTVHIEDLNDDNGRPSGTRVTVFLPLI